MRSGKSEQKKAKGQKCFRSAAMSTAPGVYELELGSKLSELVIDLASAKDIKMIQVGGACGRILPAELVDTPLSYETILGAGAVTVFNQTRDVIEMMYRNTEFLN